MKDSKRNLQVAVDIVYVMIWPDQTEWGGGGGNFLSMEI